MRIIDVHTHVGDILYGPELVDPYDKVPLTPGWITEITGYRTDKPPPGFRIFARYLEVIHNQERNNSATLENLEQLSMPYGITTSVLQPIEPARQTKANLDLISEADSGNSSGPRTTSGPKLTLKTFASIHPRDPDKEKKLLSYDRAGCLGLKLHPIIQNLPPEDPAWFETLELWRKTNKPVLFHAGVSAYYIPRGPRDFYGDASRYEPLVSSFPDVAFILAHMNMVQQEVVWELARKYDNIFADTSFQSAAMIRKATRFMGTHRLLFASDFPFSLPRYAIKAGMAATSGDPAFRARFFHDNAAGLLGLDQEDKKK